MVLWRIILVLTIMLILIARKMKLGYVMGIGAISLMILFNKIILIPNLILNTLSDFKFYEMMGIVIGINIFTGVLHYSKKMEKLIDSLFFLVKSDKGVFAFIPAIIGLLPMPGGAMFSAPLVKEVGKKIDATDEDCALANYWFRHMWEFIFPLYPGFILAVFLSKHALSEFFVKQWPMTVIGLIIGYFFILFPLKRKEKTDYTKNSLKNHLSDFFSGLWAIFLIIILTIVFKINIVLSISISLLLSIFIYKVNFKDTFDIIKKNVKFDLIVMVIGLFLFKTAIENYGELKELTNEILSYGINPYFAIIFISFLTGILTGITVGFVGLTFPLIPFLFNSNGILPFGIYMLAYLFGFLGVIISPMHLCLTLTKEYFNSAFSKLYKKLFPMAIILGFAGVFLFFTYEMM